MSEVPWMVDDFLAACAAAEARLTARREWRRELDVIARAILAEIEGAGDALEWPWDLPVSRAVDGCIILIELAAVEPPEDFA